MLLRAFLRKHLAALFTEHPEPPLASHPQPINTSALLTRSSWLNTQQHIHNHLGSKQQFFTPCELFPHHLASLLLRTLVPPSEHIIEVGAGTGAVASHASSSISWSSIELSHQLASMQRSNISGLHSLAVGDCMTNVPWQSIASQLPADCNHLTIVCNELLDNLPHDAVEWHGRSHSWQQVEIDDESNKEVLTPLRDTLIADTLDAFNASRPSRLHRAFTGLTALRRRRIYLPTGLHSMLQSARDALCNDSRFVSFFALDFAHVPDSKLPGVFAPAVATQRGYGQTTEHSGFLSLRQYGDADIIFPSDLHNLIPELCTRTLGTGPMPRIACSLSELYRHHGDVSSTAAADGFHPLLHDFHNYSVVLCQSRQNEAET